MTAPSQADRDAAMEWLERTVTMCSQPGWRGHARTLKAMLQQHMITNESCGGVESRHAEKLGGGGPQCDSVNTGKADRPTPAAGVAPGPQDDLAIPVHLRRAPSA